MSQKLGCQDQTAGIFFKNNTLIVRANLKFEKWKLELEIRKE